MSIETMAMVLYHSKAKGTDKVILIGIANHDGDGGAWPSIGRLALYGLCDRRTAQRSIRRVEELGEVKTHVQGGGLAHMDDTERPNRYEVTIECPEGCDRSSNHKPLDGWERLKDGAYVPVDNSIEGGAAPTPPRGAHAAPPGGAHAALTVPSTIQTNQGAASTTDHARASEPCRICSNGYDRCQSVQRAWPQEDRHPYSPVLRPPAVPGDKRSNEEE